MNSVKRAKDIAKGHWRQLLPQLGVDAKYLTGKHGPCPACGGKDRFRFTDRNDEGMYFCSACGANDGFKLAEIVTGKSFKQIADEISDILGQPTSGVKKVDSQLEVNRQAIKRIWEASCRPSKGGPVSKYMETKFGRLQSVRVETGKDGRFAFVTFEVPRDAWRVKQEHDHPVLFNGRQEYLRVELAVCGGRAAACSLMHTQSHAAPSINK